MEGAAAWVKMTYKSTLCLGLQALMEHWEWAHALPKPADAVFKNLWGGGESRGDFMTPSLGVE